MTAAEDALDLARAGLPCFPCGADKRPVVAGGFQAATCDPEQVRWWWQRWPDALAALPTGAPSGLWVVDLDIDKATGETVGEDSFRALGLPWPEHRCRTRTGGWHLLYRWREGLPRNTAGRLPCVDTRGDGGYVVAWAPATLVAAAADRSLPPPPDALLRALMPPPRPAIVHAFTPPRDCSRWAAAAVAAELRMVAAAPEGCRNATLNRSSFKVGQVVVAGGLDLEHVTAALMQAAVAAGLSVPEASRTIASGIAAGAKFPRQNTLNPRRPDQAAHTGGPPWTARAR